MFLEPENLTRGSLFPSWFFFTSKTTFKLLKSYKWEWGLDRLLGRSLPGPEKLSAWVDPAAKANFWLNSAGPTRWNLAQIPYYRISSKVVEGFFKLIVGFIENVKFLKNYFNNYIIFNFLTIFRNKLPQLNSYCRENYFWKFLSDISLRFFASTDFAQAINPIDLAMGQPVFFQLKWAERTEEFPVQVWALKFHLRNSSLKWV